MVMLEHEVADARPTKTEARKVVSRRFEFVEVTQQGEASGSAHARYLDYRPLDEHERELAEPLLSSEWLGRDFDKEGLDHAIEASVPVHLAEVRARTLHRVETTRKAVHERLTKEVNHWDNRAAQLQLDVDAGAAPRMNVDAALRRAEDYARRLEHRLSELDREMTLSALPPRVVGGALVLPAGLLERLKGGTGLIDPAADVVARREVERRAINAVLKAEDEAGWEAEDMNETHPNHPGYDICSTRRGSTVSEYRYIEVKGRVTGADVVTVSRNEILTSLNEPDRWLLALVEVRPEGGEEVRYLHRPFDAGTRDCLFDVTSVNFDWKALWARGQAPRDCGTGAGL